MIISDCLIDGISFITPEDFLSNKCTLRGNEAIINLCSDLRFMKSGYYVSLYAMGHKVIPIIEDLSDLYCPPLAFRRLQGKVPMIAPRILDEAPDGKGRVIIFPVNQLNKERYFIAGSSYEKQRYYEKASLNHRYPVAILPLRGKLREVTVIFGDCTDESKESKRAARRIYSEFQIPVFRLLMQSGKFSGMLPCSPKRLNKRERELLADKLREIEGGRQQQWER